MPELTPLIPALEDPENMKKFSILDSKKREQAYRCVMWLKEMFQQIPSSNLARALANSTGHSLDEMNEFVQIGAGNVETWDQVNDAMLKVIAGHGKEVEIAEKDPG